MEIGQCMDGNANSSRVCRKCKKTNVSFSPSRIKTGNYICTRCNNKERDSDPARYLARKLSNILKKEGAKKPYPGTSFVRKIIAKCEGSSVLSEESNIRKLCVIRREENKPWTVENAVLVTSGESYALTRAATGKFRERVFANL